MHKCMGVEWSLVPYAPALMNSKSAGINSPSLTRSVCPTRTWRQGISHIVPENHTQMQAWVEKLHRFLCSAITTFPAAQLTVRLIRLQECAEPLHAEPKSLAYYFPLLELQHMFSHFCRSNVLFQGKINAA